jgi:hypothetical protein
MHPIISSILQVLSLRNRGDFQERPAGEWHSAPVTRWLWARRLLDRIKACCIMGASSLSCRPVPFSSPLILSLLNWHQTATWSAVSHFVTSFTQQDSTYKATVTQFNSLWNSKVHCRVRKTSPLAPFLSQMNPTHTSASYSLTCALMLSFNLSQGTQQSSSFSFSDKNPLPVSISHFFACPHLFRSPWFH